MKPALLWLAPAAVFLLAAPLAATASTRQDIQTCEHSKISAEAAVQACTRVLKAVRSSSTRRLALADRASAYVDIGKNEEAVADATQLIEQGGGDKRLLAFARDVRARAYYWLEDDLRALVDALMAVKLDSSHASYFVTLASINVSLGNGNVALGAVQQAIALDPKDADAYVTLSDVYAELKRFDDAIGAVETAQKLDPESVGDASLAMAYFDRGDHFLSTGNVDAAIADFSKAINLSPSYWLALGGRGQAYVRKRLFGKAIPDLTAAIDNKVDYDGTMRLDRANAYVATGALDKAVADYSVVIGISKPPANAYAGRGNVYVAEQKYDLAIADLTAAIKLNASDAALYVERGSAYLDKGDLGQAMVDLNTALTIDKTDSAALLQRGDTYFARGDLAKTIADYSQAITLAPKYAPLRRDRGLAEIYAGQLPQAEADLNYAMNLDPSNAYAAIWFEMAGERDKLKSRLADAAAKLDLTKWPGPVVQLFLGQLSPAATLASVTATDPATKAGQVCEADFYGGEWKLLHGDAKGAADLFHKAEDECPGGYTEKWATSAELAQANGPGATTAAQ